MTIKPIDIFAGIFLKHKLKSGALIDENSIKEVWDKADDFTEERNRRQRSELTGNMSVLDDLLGGIIDDSDEICDCPSCVKERREEEEKENSWVAHDGSETPPVGRASSIFFRTEKEECTIPVLAGSVDWSVVTAYRLEPFGGEDSEDG